jgi:anti-anti-sigma regulatory factor
MGMHAAKAQVAGEPDAAAMMPHWHLVGQRWRPLHEQLAALRDAGVWAGAIRGRSAGSWARADDDCPTPLTVGVAQLGTDFAAVTASGPLEPRTVQYLGGQLRLLLEAGVRDLVVDLAEVTCCDLRFAGMLLPLRARLQARHGTLVLLNPPPDVRNALSVGRLPDSFMYCPMPRCAVTTVRLLRRTRSP